MRKYFVMCLASVLVTACSSDEASVRGCGLGTAVGLISSNLTQSTSDNTETHLKGNCTSDEYCVNLYTQDQSTLVKIDNKYACSKASQGHLLCGEIEVDALTDANNCGACDNKCETSKSCTNGVCEVSDRCDDNAMQCSADKKQYQVCQSGKWVTLGLCTAGCQNNACLPDADGDGVTDAEDECPYNKDHTTGIPLIDGASSCLPFADGVFTIYSAHNLLEFAGIISGKFTQDLSGHNIPESVSKDTIHTLRFTNDVNFADVIAIANETECVISKDVWTGELALSNIKIEGNNKTIKAETTNGVRCSLQRSLFNSLTNSTVKDLNIDLDVNSDAAQSIFANTISVTNDKEAESSLDNITLSGTLSTQFNNTIECDSEDSETTTDCNSIKYSGVGSLAGTVIGIEKTNNDYIKTVQISNCSIDNVSVIAKSANNVGGLIGFANGATIRYGSDVNYVNYVEGQNNVGGLIGKAYYNNVNKSNEGEYSTFIINEVKGNSYVGGYAGTGLANNIIIAVNSIKAEGDVAGGIFGSAAGTNTSNGSYTNSTPLNIAYYVNSVSGKTYIGGLAGNIPTYTITAENIYGEALSIIGEDKVAGFSGHSNSYSSSFSCITLKTGLISGNNSANGVTYTSHQSFLAETISSCSNIKSANESTISGGIDRETKHSPQPTLTNFVVTSSRFLETETETTKLSTNAMTTPTSTISAESSYYGITVEGETASDTDIEGVAGFSESEAKSVAAALGEGWEVEACRLLNDDGKTFKTFMMPMYQQKELSEKLTALKNTVKERGLFEIHEI